MRLDPIKASARGAATLVALVAGAASYEHIASVALGASEARWVAYSLPLAIDGLIIVGVSGLLEDKRAGRAGRWSARLAVAVGVLATLAANIASAEPTMTARLVAVAAPVAFLLSVEVLTRTGRARAEEGPDGAPAKPVVTRPTRTRRSASERVAAAVRRSPGATAATLAARLGVSERTVQRHLRALADDMVSPVPAPVDTGAAS